ncbi:ClpXP protease specificity-enhancing factor [Arenicella sp. 4NH20-0111]|uniref:ClpXP protease specificity-enhancing factor n=1 Tax=Arenicella sp. 4NH20-0111 TaxID=3127648 RepID=UPI0031062978
MTSTKPYLLRAIFEWAEDNSLTPQVLVNAEYSGVEVPEAHIVDGQIVLNIGSSAVRLHVMDNECLSFSARFSGVEYDIYLPMDAIMAIFARENSQGIFFEDTGDDSDPDPDKGSKPDVKKVEPTPIKSGEGAKKSSHLKVVK